MSSENRRCPSDLYRKKFRQVPGFGSLDTREATALIVLPQHQPPPSVIAEGAGGRAAGEGDLSSRRFPPGGHRRPPAARLRWTGRRLRQGQPSDPPGKASSTATWTGS